MARKSTPSFITEIPLETDAHQEKVLLKRLDMVRRVYNACLGEAISRAEAMKADAGYKTALRMPKGDPKSPERRARNRAFSDLRERHAFGEYHFAFIDDHTRLVTHARFRLRGMSNCPAWRTVCPSFRVLL